MFKPMILGALLITGSTAFAADFNVDPAHSSVNFQIGHLGTSTTVGRFNEFEGTFSYDDNMSNVSAKFTVQTASVDTNHDARDKHLRSPDFLDVKQFPTMTFSSTKFEGDTLTGNLTLHGQTKPVEFSVEKVGAGNDPWGGYRAGFVATTTIKRSDFGVTYFIPGVSDETTIQVFVEGIRQ